MVYYPYSLQHNLDRLDRRDSVLSCQNLTNKKHFAEESNICVTNQNKLNKMFARLFRIPQLTQAIKTRVNAIETSIASKFVFPEKYKGTIWEKWAKYWQHLGIDYKDVFVNVVQQTKQKPILASIYFATGGTLYYCVQNNPSEEDFRVQLRNYNADCVMVHDSCLNKTSTDYIKFVETCSNQGILRYLSLGFISFLWLDNYDQNASLYKAVCEYTDPQYLTFHDRVIDIGFMNKWWNLSRRMRNYDVNF